MADCVSNAAELVNFLRGEAKELSTLANGKTECNALWKAADAIEQLVKERDEWKTLGSLANKRAEDYRDMRRQRDEAIKERDAAVADIKENWLCASCEKRVIGMEWCRCKSVSFSELADGGVTCENYEWRGVQKEEEDVD